MSKTYFAFAVADGMFSGEVVDLRRETIDVERVREFVAAGVIPALNPAHASTIAAMRARFGLDVQIPERAPLVTLGEGDSLIVMSVRGLPRREGVAEYSDAEIAAATFVFSLWTVRGVYPF